MLGMRSVAAFAAAALIGVAYAQAGAPAARTAAALAQQASPDTIAYAAFQADLSDLAAMEIASESAVDAALDRAARHDRNTLVRGWMSYAADVAAQAPAFVESVRALERREGRYSVSRITSNRSFARRLPGSDDATRLVLAALAADATRVAAVAARHRGLADSLQDQAWGGAVAAGRDERLERIRALAAPGGFTPQIAPSVTAQLVASPISISLSETAFGGHRFWDAISQSRPILEEGPASAHWRVDEARPETLDAIFSVAALRVLGAQQTQASAISYFLSDPRACGCVEMARLELYSCLSAAHFVYENEYCLAEHGLRDVALCMSAPILHDEAYMTAIATRATPSAALTIAAATAVAVPTELEGAPEAADAAPAAVTPEPAEAASLPGTAEGPTASPVVAVAPLPAPVPAPVVAQIPAAAPSPPAAAQLGDMGAGELFALADELDEQGQTDQARAARRALIARFPDSPLALLAAQRLAGAPSRPR